MDQTNVVTINGVEYEEDALEISQKYLVMQIRDLQQQRSTLQMKLDQTQAALQSMTNDLIKSVTKEAVDE